jgi:hypothetical protein
MSDATKTRPVHVMDEISSITLFTWVQELEELYADDFEMLRTTGDPQTHSTEALERLSTSLHIALRMTLELGM